MLISAGQVLDAVARGIVLCGTRRALAGSMGVSSADLVAALDRLVAAGWVRIVRRPGGRLVIS